MVVFNIHAFFQALLIGIIFGILFLCGVRFENEILWAYALHFFVMFTYRSLDLKGKLFWIFPTWLFSLGYVFILNNGWSNYDNDSTVSIYKTINYLVCFILLIRVFYNDNKDFYKKFLVAKTYFNQLDKSQEFFETDKKQFWVIMSNVYVKPFFVFEYVMPLYNLIFKPKVDEVEYVKHHLEVLRLMKEKLSNTSKIIELTHTENSLIHFLKSGFNKTRYSVNYNSVLKIISAEHDLYPDKTKK